MISPILQTRRLRSREVRPFPGRACRWPVTVGEAEPVSPLPTRLPWTLLMAAYPMGRGPGRCLPTRLPRTLLMEYVRYARDAALDVFENNYLSLLLDMQQRRAVERFVESSASTEE